MVTSILRAAIRKPNTEGLVPSTVGIDLVHTLGINRSGVTRTAIIRKIMVYNNTGGPVTLQLGTQDFTVPIPLFVQYIPDLLAVNGLDTEWNESEIPATEFSRLALAAALGREGNIYLQALDALGAGVAGVLVTLEVDEIGS